MAAPAKAAPAGKAAPAKAAPAPAAAESDSDDDDMFADSDDDVRGAFPLRVAVCALWRRIGGCRFAVPCLLSLSSYIFRLACACAGDSVGWLLVLSLLPLVAAPCPLSQGADKKAKKEAAKKAALAKANPVVTHAKKEGPVERTQCVYEVKPAEAGQDMADLEARVRGIKKEGLSWGEAFKVVDVAYGIQKLIVQFIIDDRCGLQEVEDAVSPAAYVPVIFQGAVWVWAGCGCLLLTVVCVCPRR